MADFQQWMIYIILILPTHRTAVMNYILMIRPGGTLLLLKYCMQLLSLVAC